MKKMVLIGSELMSSNRSRRVVGLSRSARWLKADFRITWHQTDSWSDASFNADFDAFEGFSVRSALDGDHWKRSDLAIGEALVTRNLDRFAERIASHKGWTPARFDADELEKMVTLRAGGGLPIEGQATSPVPSLPGPGPRE